MIKNLKNLYETPLGKTLIRLETAALAKILPKKFGYYSVQIGGNGNNNLLNLSPIHHQIFLNFEQPASSQNQLKINCDPEKLPLLPESIDLILLYHLLEFSSSPKLILKETYDALIHGGYLVILGFNPYSLWGIKKFFHPQGIFRGNWLSIKKLSSILTKLGFSIEQHQTFYFCSANQKEQQLPFLEKIGKILWPDWGACFILVAQKRSLILTPVNKTKSFALSNHKLTKPLPKPTSQIAEWDRN